MLVSIPLIKIFNKKIENKKENLSFSTKPFLTLTKPLNQDTFEKRIVPSDKISFQSSGHCSESDFQVKNIPNLRCPVCNQITLTQSQIKAFADDISYKKGEELIYALEKYENENIFINNPKPNNKGIYRPLKQEIVNIIKDLAKQYPDKNILSLVKIKANKCMNDLINSQMQIMQNYEEYVNNNLETEEEKNRAKKVIDEYTKQIKGETNTIFARKKFIYAAKNVTNFTDKKTEIEKIVSKIPTSNNNVNAFFVKYAKTAKSPYDLARKLVCQSIPTAEHLKTKSKGGGNRLKNFICDCADCNGSRSDTPFYNWQKTIPDFEQNLQEYIETIQKAVDEGVIDSNYEYYIPQIIDVINEMSKGEIELKYTDSTNDVKIQETMQKRKVEIQRYKNQLQKQINQKTSLEAQIQELEKYQHYKNIVQIKTILKEIEKTQIQLNDLKAEIANIQQEYEKYKKQLENFENQLSQTDRKNKKRKTLAKRKDMLEKTISLTNHNMKQKQKELNSLEEKLARLKEKHKTIQSLTPSNATIRNEVIRLKNLISRYEKYEEEITLNEKKINEETKQKTSYQEALKEMEEAKNENEKIMQIPNFNSSNASTYQEYKRIGNIHNYAISEYNKNKTSSKENKEKKLRLGMIKIAIDATGQQMKELSELPEVKYFINQERIKVNQRRAEKLLEKLNEIETFKTILKTLKEEYEELSKDKTLKQLNQEYEKAKKECESIEQIEQISNLRQELDSVKDTISYNEEIMAQLAKYKSLTNEEYRQLTSRLFLN